MHSRLSQCSCDGALPSCLYSKDVQLVEAGVECCKVETNCSSFIELCNPAWLVPLHIPEMVLTMHCEVVYNGIGPYLESHRWGDSFTAK